MSKVSEAVRLIKEIAADNSHGYLWGGWGPDYDCGHLIITVLEQAGIPVKTAGASYTGNMKRVFLACGAMDVTSKVNLKTGAGMKACDVLINEKEHAAMYVGEGKIVQARSNFDGKPGDSSGQEIREQAYYNYPWDCVLRFEDEPAEAEIPVNRSEFPNGSADSRPMLRKDTNVPTVTGLPTLRRGASGPVVEAAQLLLIGRGYPCGGSMAIDGREEPDGVFGPVMSVSVFRWQSDHGLDDDSIIGPVTWASLMGLNV